MPVGRTLFLAAIFGALALAMPVAAQSYVVELSGGKLVEARSTQGLAPSLGASVQGSGSHGLGAAGGNGGPSSQPASLSAARGSRSAGVTFGSCAEAARAGYSSMREGTPGYREGLDGDYDGIACEPYRGQNYRRQSYRRR